MFFSRFRLFARLKCLPIVDDYLVKRVPPIRSLLKKKKKRDPFHENLAVTFPPTEGRLGDL